MSDRVRVLHVGADPTSGVQEALVDGGFTVERFSMAEQKADDADLEALSVAGEGADAVVVDTPRPATAVSLVRNSVDVPVPVVAVVADPDDGRRALDAGAIECFRRAEGAYDLLAQRVRRTVRPAPPGGRDPFERLVEDVGTPVFVLDADGVVEYVNPAAADLIGADRTSVVYSHVTRFVDRSTVRRGATTVAETLDEDRRFGTFEFEASTSDGDVRAFEATVSPLTDGDVDARDGYDGVVGLLHDVTERERRTEQLSRQNERLEEFASVVSHDLRNPLGVIDGNLGLARETGEKRYLDEIDVAVEYMEALIDELLALAREGKVVSETEPVSLSAVAEDAWKRIDADDTDFLGAPERTVSADRPRLRELFENLFRNAVEHTGPGVTVRVETEETGFAVVDDGPGIAPERREKVFERRFSTADGGTGLGLSIVERIAEAHGWSVTATEGNAGGTRIVIETAVGPTGDGPEGESAGTDPSGSGAVDG
jgi:PAS domain S-box-containing protein